MRTVKLDCGCAYAKEGEREYWTRGCEPHESEYQELHERAQRERSQSTDQLPAGNQT